MREVEAAAGTLGLTVVTVEIRRPEGPVRSANSSTPGVNYGRRLAARSASTCRRPCSPAPTRWSS